MLRRLPAGLASLLGRAGVPLGKWIASSEPGLIPPRQTALVLLRVDDYPHWQIGTDVFWRFHEVLVSANVPYLLAVTPFLAADPLAPESSSRPIRQDEWDRLTEAVRRGELEVALHGTTHRTRKRRFHSEFDGLRMAEARKRLAEGWARLVEQGCDPVAFVPPFNRLPPALWDALPPNCHTVCLGPESLGDVPLCPAIARRDGRIGVFSLPPFYGRAAAILAALEQGEWLARPEAVLPITLHWTWERDDEFAGVARLARRIAPHVSTWRTLTAAAR